MKALVNRKETIYFILLLITSIPLYLLLILSGVGLIVLGILVILPIIAHLVFTAHIRVNGVKITERQFPEVYFRTREISKDMGFYFLPDVYVIQSGGLLNAFATRFFGRNMVVLYSDLFEEIETNPTIVDFVIAHELAHIKRNHIMKQALVLPANWIPFLGSAYSRACEYTSDRMASHYINNFEASTQALTMLAVGRKYFQTIDQHEYMLNSSREKGFVIWLSEKFMSHPTLPKRIDALYRFHNIENTVEFKTPKRVYGIAAILIVLSVGALIGIGALADKAIPMAKSFVDGYEAESEMPKDTPLTAAVLDNDIEKVKKLIKDGADVNELNGDSESPLFTTTYLNDDHIDLNMLKLLLDSGADPSIGDQDDWTVLHAAVSMGDKDAIDLLLKYGANINQQDIYGETPIFETTYEVDDVKTFQYLVDKGADLTIKNADGMTVNEVAKDNGAKKILKWFDNKSELKL
ncbi:M48 family metallopeptidase [Gottfriedia luciferensis]|uniref:M48 family metallopeptidase n=1 Tax=Gottfriedia luciferensis TaxID=178774 RepID=UPI000B43AFEA|nr:M48 family metalloprotease [Gottfriedia luciferensis]